MKNKRKNKKQNSDLIMNALISIFVFLVVVVLVAALVKKDEVYQELEDEGYYTETEDAFYKKILTNNSLNEFYNDMNSGRNAKYQEVYVSKTSYDYIELIMEYTDGMTTSLTISSNLKSNEVNYNYEMSHEKAYLLIEGTEKNNYACNVNVNRNVKKEIEKKHCSLIKTEIQNYLNSKVELLNNQNLIDKIYGN